MNKQNINNCKRSICKGGGLSLTLILYKSSSRFAGYYLSKGVRYYSSSRQITYDNYEDITSEVLNTLLANQQVSITQKDLDRLKAIPGVKFDLPFNDETFSSFTALVGKPNTRGLRAGVYIFTHKATGNKYVGSSNSLSRRLNQYFTFQHFNPENSGLFLPLLKKEGFEAFSLEIFVIPSDFSVIYNLNYFYLFLEQYYLLNKNFNLNTQRIVNFRVNQGKKIYIYDAKGKILYYSSKSLNQIKYDLGIHYATCTSCIKNGDNYLDFFKITDIFIEDAENSNINLSELVNLISIKKEEFLKNTSRTKFSKSVVIKGVENGETKEFPSITASIKYLESLNIRANKDQVTK